MVLRFMQRLDLIAARVDSALLHESVSNGFFLVRKMERNERVKFFSYAIILGKPRILFHRCCFAWQYFTPIIEYFLISPIKIIKKRVFVCINKLRSFA